MRLICLNIWGARAGADVLLKFLSQHQETDIFCLQEMWNGGEHTRFDVAAGRNMEGVEFRLLEKVSAVLPEYAVYFVPQYCDFFGLAILSKKTLPVVQQGSFYVYKQEGYVSPEDIADHARLIQYLTVETPEGLRTIMNFHGAWQAAGKGDTPDRKLQSENIVRFTKSLTHPFVVCGDFNLLPTTDSLRMLEEAGMRNLITEYQITSTRTSLYPKSIRYADYVLVSDGISVEDFHLLPEEVSDHAAISLRFR